MCNATLAVDGGPTIGTKLSRFSVVPIVCQHLYIYKFISLVGRRNIFM